MTLLPVSAEVLEYDRVGERPPTVHDVTTPFGPSTGDDRPVRTRLDATTRTMTRNPHRSTDESVPTYDLDEQVRDALPSASSDPECRAILRATAGRAHTAAELFEALGLPLSTTSRKLDRPAATPLLEATYRLASYGEHAYRYRCVVDRVHIALPED